ncbi:prephenate dehydratase domain-containing protein [Streptomyces sp. AP-93]|uniref:prephenate dehydratase domain-containing protein n=1 Tax=Streptomyces sp. AP-93 TaxID=2929048 RepID=UPI0035AFFD56
MKYASLGPRATFTEAALRSLPDASRKRAIPHVTVPDAPSAARSGASECAVVPLENLRHGSRARHSEGARSRIRSLAHAGRGAAARNASSR